MRSFRGIARSEEGFIKGLLLLAIFVVAVYAGVQFGMPYYRHYAFQSDIKDIVRIELGTVEKIREKVLESAKGFKVPVEEEDIVIVKKEKSVLIKASWSDTVDIFGLYQKTVDFSVNIEE